MGWMEPQLKLGHAACWWPCHCRARLLTGAQSNKGHTRCPILRENLCGQQGQESTSCPSRYRTMIMPAAERWDAAIRKRRDEVLALG